MATTSGLNAQQLQIKIDELKAAGKTESTSKELGKYVNALKVLTPEKYGTQTVKDAQAKLNATNQPQAGNTVNVGSANGVGGTVAGVPNLSSTYDAALAGSGIPDLEKQLNEKKQALVDAQTNINDNPWYSEATRVGKLSKLNTQAQSEITNLESDIAQKRADAQVKVNIATKQYELNSDAHKQAISDLNNLIATGAINSMSGTDIANLAVQTGLSTSQIKAIQEKAAIGSMSPQLQTDDNGNVTIFDANTGKIINTISGIGKADKGGTGTGKTTDKDVGVAIQILNEADVSNYGTADKKLADWEIKDAYNQLLNKYGNSETALTLLESAISRGGFSKWEG